MVGASAYRITVVVDFRDERLVDERNISARTFLESCGCDTYDRICEAHPSEILERGPTDDEREMSTRGLLGTNRKAHTTRVRATYKIAFRSVN